MPLRLSELLERIRPASTPGPPTEERSTVPSATASDTRRRAIDGEAAEQGPMDLPAGGGSSIGLGHELHG